MLELGEPALDKNGVFPRYPGEEITLEDGQKITLGQWNLRALKMGCAARAVLRDAAAKGDIDTPEAYDAMRHICWISLQLNYPHVVEEALDDGLAVSDLHFLSQKIMAQLTRRKGEDDRGEATAVAKTAETIALSNGTTSSQ